MLETSVDELPNEISKIYRDLGVATVMVVPVSLSFTSTQFRSTYTVGALSNTVFLKDVSFDTSTSLENMSFWNSVFCENAKFNSMTAYNISFPGTVFKDSATFSEGNFTTGADFDRAVFEGDVWFDGEKTFAETASFYQTTVKGSMTFHAIAFKKLVNFAEANIVGSVNFNYCNFAEDVFFIDLNNVAGPLTGQLKFRDSVFFGRVNFTKARIDKLWFFPNEVEEYRQLPRQTRSRQLASPVSFKQRAVFSGLECNAADFREVEFREFADFSSAQFKQSANFSNTSYEGGASFYNTGFPYHDSTATATVTSTGLVLDGVQFPKGVILTWKQLDGKLNATDPETFRRLEDVFTQSGDLEGHNSAMYHRRRVETQRAAGLQRLINWVDFAFWGYGVRPLRLLGWLFVCFSAFTMVYWTQTKALKSGGSKLGDAWNRLIFAISFSLRTSWTLGFGYKNSRTLAFKIITLVQSIGFKVLLILLLQAFANTSPLLNELIGKLVRV